MLTISLRRSNTYFHNIILAEKVKSSCIRPRGSHDEYVNQIVSNIWPEVYVSLPVQRTGIFPSYIIK
jgi:hypothetical protein